jgi:acyl-coenzyme A thioesterase PaaI-like protein
MTTEDIPHPGDVEHHIMRDLGFVVVPDTGKMVGSAQVVPEMWVPGTTVLRTSILAAWADMVAGYLAIGLFDPGVPVTLDLDVHVHEPPADRHEVRMSASVEKAGRSVSVLAITIDDGDGGRIGFAHATFMAAPNPSLRMPTVVRDDGLLHAHPPLLEEPFAARAGCERSARGRATIPLRPDGLNASGTLNGGLLALVVEEAALSASPLASTVSSLWMRFVQPVRLGPAVAVADLHDDLGNVVVRDTGRDDRLAVIATVRTDARDR